MRRPRLRTLLIAVAVVALALGGWTMWKRREFCRLMAERMETMARMQESWAALYESLGVPNNRVKHREMVERAYRSAARYRHVARYPWLPLPREPE